jgi:hypothetical protein
MSILHVVQKCRKSGKRGIEESRFRDIYQVLTDGIDEDRDSVLSAIDPNTGLAIPRRGELHPENGFYYAREISADQDQDPHNANNWYVVVEYTNKITSTDLTKLLQFDPTKWAPKISSGRNYMDVPLYKDRDGVPCRNSAGETFDRPVLIKKGYLLYKYLRHFAAIPDWYYTLDQCTNESPITIYGKTFAPATALVNALAASELKYEEGVAFYTLTCDILINEEIDTSEDATKVYTTRQEDGHKLLIANRGFKELIPYGGIGNREPLAPYEPPMPKLVDIADDKGNKFTVPATLDEDGRHVREDDDPSNDLNKRFRLYNPADYGVLGLPP